MSSTSSESLGISWNVCGCLLLLLQIFNHLSCLTRTDDGCFHVAVCIFHAWLATCADIFHFYFHCYFPPAAENRLLRCCVSFSVWQLCFFMSFQPDEILLTSQLNVLPITSIDFFFPCSLSLQPFIWNHILRQCIFFHVWSIFSALKWPSESVTVFILHYIC